MAQTFRDLHAFSIGPSRSAFWSHLFDFAGLIHEGRAVRPVDESSPIDAVPPWFEGVRLNFAENILFSSSSSSSSPPSAGTGGGPATTGARPRD